MAANKGWSTWESYQVADVFEHHKRYYDQIAEVIGDCRSDGMTRAQTVNRVADEMKDIIGGEFYEARSRMTSIVNALTPHERDMDIEYKALAEYFVDSIGSRAKQRSDNRKAPAKKPTQRRR